MISEQQKLQSLRAVDKYDRVGDLGVFELLTTGRTDESGDHTPGVGLSSSSAMLIIKYLNSGKTNRIANRMKMIELLDSTEVAPSKTAWDILLEMPARPDNLWKDGGRPENIAFALDDLCESVRKKGERDA